MQSVVLFDGVCNLCSGLARWVIARDPSGRLRFASLQSAAARRLLHELGAQEPRPDSIALVEAGRLYERSTAVLRLARHLRFPWCLLNGFLVVPRPVRDLVYNYVARRRYGWFGRRAACVAAPPDRFLE